MPQNDLGVMRLRHTAAVAIGALALLVAQPGTASAAAGDFSYDFAGLDGMPRTVILHDPPSPGCVTLPEVADTRSAEPAFAPDNDTDEWVMVFSEPDCTGDSWTLRPHGNPTTDRLKLRSVYLTGRH
ncbi:MULTISPECIES: hypothetical protein [unclassified Streptomyces]|uniref:hypothetical protein n=1 Tax=unclassified Streptomyces TaxID=2593676 RepID=UPI002E2BEF35|nr:hypothetical protein [Streptomyces sp. NBC_01423]